MLLFLFIWPAFCITNAAVNTVNYSGINKAETKIDQMILAPVAVCKNITVQLGTNGSVSISATSVDNGSYDPDGTITNLTVTPTTFDCSKIGANTVTLTVTDNEGLSASCDATVTVEDKMAPVVATKNYTLNLDAAGTGSITPENVDNDTYDNCGAVTLSVSPNSFSCEDLGDQTVTLTATDSHGNSSSRTAVVTVASTLKINSILVSSCDLMPTLAIYKPEVEGGTGSYSYLWKSIDGSSRIFMSISPLQFGSTSSVETPFFNNNLNNGQYGVSLDVTDENGCKVSSEITINQTTKPIFNNHTYRNSDACEGEIRTYSANYDPDATYAWSVTNGTILEADQNTSRISVQWNMGVSQGVVSSTISKENSQFTNGVCESYLTDNVTISPFPAPAFQDQETTVCSGSVNTYTLTDTYTSQYWSVTGGVITSGGGISDNYATVLWNDVPSATISVSVGIGSSCLASAILNIEPHSLQATIASQTDITCNGGSDGTVTVDVVTGTGNPPYQYSIDNGDWQANNLITGISLGNHFATVRDASLCTYNVPFVISQPTPVSGTISSLSNTSCFGDSDGSATVTASGGSPSYEYSLNGGAYQSSNVFNGLLSGSYTATIRDSHGCQEDVAFTITSPDLLGGSITSNNVSCHGGSNGTVNLTVTGGTTPYSYLWSNGATSEDLTNVAAGTYSVTITDANGCLATANTTVTEPAQVLSGSTVVTNVACFGGSTGAVNLTAVGGTSPYTFLWSNGATSEDLTDVPAGTYSVTINDINGCTAASTGQVLQPSAATGGSITSQTNISCFGGNNGSVTVAGTGGVSPYEYSLGSGAFQSSGTFNNLTAGIYNITIRDANQCSFIQSVTITQPASALTGNIISQTDIKCLGEATGSITVSGTGGTAPYEYNISYGKFQTSGTFNYLIGGSYLISVRDANLCEFTMLVTIDEPTAPLGGSIVSKTDVNCYSTATGSVTVAGSGATAPYTYSIDGGAFQSSGTFNSLAAGAHTVLVRDYNLCGEYSLTVNISQPSSALGVTTTKTDVLCQGGSTGSATAVATGGTAPYIYSWNTTPVQNNAVAGGLTAGNYTVTVTDSKGCVATSSVIITQPADAMTATTSAVNISCYGNSTGSVNLTVVNGKSPLAYLWSNGATSEDLNNVPAGTYTVSVTDANGCTATASTTVTQPSAALSGSITSQTDVTVYGGSNGSVTVSGTNGTSPYQYKLGTGSYQSSGTFGSLAAGTYTVTVRDAGLCTFDVPVTITQPWIPLTANILSQTNVLCNGGSTGSVTVAGWGGTSPYQYSLNGGTFQASGTFSGLSAGTYSITVRDAVPDLFDIEITITEPDALGITFTKTDLHCFGDSNGSATAVVTGGTGPFSFAWNTSPVQTTAAATGLSAGSHSVNVTDANGCIVSGSVSLTQPSSALSGITSVTNVACYGGSNGAVNLTVTGGTSPYTYLWSNGATSKDISGVTSGTYTVTITDVNGCTATATGQVLQPSAAVGGSITSQNNVSCFGGNNGNVTVTGTGGVAPYEYRLGSGAYQSSGTFSDLSSGTYNITIRDFNQCTFVQNVNITQPLTSLSGSISSQTNILCKGNATGSITIAGAGGTAPYEYSINGGSFRSSGTFNNLIAASYLLTVRDKNLCTFSFSVTLTEPAASVSGTIISQTDVNCYSDNTGAVTVLGSGGSSTFTYSIDGGAFQPSGTFNNLVGGAHTVIVRDFNLCEYNVTVNILRPSSALSVTTTKTDVLCQGGSTGTATAVATGGTAPYTYSWNTTPVQTGAVASGLAAGNYSVTVTDSKGCTASANVVINLPSVTMTATTSVVNIDCNGSSTGSVDLTVVNGISPLAYLWSNGATSEDLNSVPAGTYTVSVTDANGCEAAASATVTQPDAIDGSITLQTDILCKGEATGSITVSGTGGTAPYEYSISGGNFQSSGTFNNLIGGSYIIVIRDANLCTFGMLVTIFEPLNSLSGTVVSQTDVTCYSSATGSVTIAGSGGTLPYTYSIDGGAFQPSGTFNNLLTGEHTVVIHDFSLCEYALTVDISQPSSALSVTTTKTDILCQGGTTGTATAAPTGGTAPYTYSWNTTPVQTGAVASGLAAGNYSVTVTDSKGCTASANVVINLPSVTMTATTSVVNVDCNGSSTGSVDLTVGNGTSPLIYLWSNGATSEDLSNVPAGTYTVSVTDANGCEAAASATVTQPDALDGSISSQTNILCKGEATGSITVSGTGGTAPYEYSINGGSFRSSGTFNNLIAASYLLTVRDKNLCTFSFSVTLTEPAASVSGTIISQTDVNCYSDNTGAVTVSGSGGSSTFTYSIDGGAFQPSGTFNNLVGGTHTVIVRDFNLCEYNVTVNILRPSSALSVTTTKTDVLCQGGSTGTATAVATGGTAPYTYSWNTTPVQTGAVAGGLAAGNYSVTVTDSKGCTASANVVINLPSVTMTATTSVVNIDCNGSSTGSVDLTVVNGISPLAYLWSNGATSEDLSNVPAGTYTVSVTDANGCEAAASATVTQPDAIDGSITLQTDILCKGEATGSITVSGTGGTAPYEYSISGGNFQSSGTFNNLIGGSYIIVIRDANLCTFGMLVTIFEPLNSLSGTVVSQTDVTCYSSATGSVTIAGSGGTLPYTYSIDGGAFQPSGTFNNLLTGEHTVVIHDFSLCEYALTVDISQPAEALSVTTTKTDISCQGGATGTATAVATGGTAPYTYSWNTTPAQTSDVAGGLAAGNYSVTVTDSKGCTASANVVINLPSVTMTATTSVVNVDCNGSSTGSVDLTVENGTTPLIYLWSNGATSEDLSNVPAGTYTVSVTDANGCEAAASATVTQPDAIDGSITLQTDILCKGEATGSITVSGTGGTAPYEYSISGGNFQSSGTFNNLIGGSYIIVIRDANICTFGMLVTIFEPLTSLSGTIVSKTDVTCNSATTGSVTAAGSDGTLPYTYSIDGGAFQPSGTFDNLAAGGHTVVIRDFNLCEYAFTVDISQPATALSVTTTKTDISCNGGGTGTATALAVGGTAPYTYSWNTTPAQTSDVASGLAAGNYSVTVTDGNGCIATSDVVIAVPSAVLTATTSVVNVSCFGSSTGSVDLTVENGTSPLIYLWSNGATSEDLSNVPAGTYTVAVTDANGCESAVSATVTGPSAALGGSIVSQTDVIVFGDSDGSVTVSGAGGTSPYQYKLDDGDYQVSGTFSSLAAGTYTVTVQDAGLCTFDVPVTITQPWIALTGKILSQTNVLCNAGNTGSVTISGWGGTLPYEYSLDGGVFQTSGTFGGLSAGTYTITIRDAVPDLYDIEVTITEPEALGITFTKNDLHCFGASDGNATAAVTGGVAPFNFTWNTSPVQTTATATELPAGLYSVTVTDGNGCTVSGDVILTQPVTGTTITLSQINILCSGGTTGSATVLATGGAEPYTYSWSTSPVQATPTAVELPVGDYSITVTDNDGCSVSGSVQITEPETLVVTSSSEKTSCPGSENGSITLTVEGGTAPYSFIWSDGILTQNRTNIKSGNYSVVVSDANACAKSLDVEVGYETTFNCLEIPQVITPNGDGYNDEWIIKNIDMYPDAEVLIYNRWGKLVFKTKNLAANPWDGRSGGKLVPTDSYHYILYLNDGSEPRAGVISVIH